MQTLKTAVVVVLLLVVFYGVYEMLNRPPDAPPKAVVEAQQLDSLTLDVPNIGLGDLADEDSLATSPPAVSPADSEATGGVPTPPSMYGSVAPPEGAESASSREMPNPPSLQLPTEPDAAAPAAPQLPPPAPPLATPSAGNPGSTIPPTGSLVPGNSNVVNNPFVHEDVVTRPSGSSSGRSGTHGGSQVYQRALKLAKAQIANGEYHAALSTLSVWYKSQELTPDEHRELLDLLDPLAGRVVYSREHIIERPYKVRRNERLADIAAQYNVPPQLLQKINGIENPDVLLPGSELKVLRGPFEAEVDLQGQELTVFLDGLYAGRFPITVGSDPEPAGGEFQVRDKQTDKAYFAMDGRMIPADSPANPFGHVWLDLGREVCIHGSPLGGADQHRGCISLSPRDADDVYSILSVGSRVRILR